MKPVIAYGFDKNVAKRLGRAKFLQKHSALFPHLDLEMIWFKMFPKAKETKEDNTPEAEN